MAKEPNTQMVRIDRATAKRLKELQVQLDGTEGMHVYYARDWHGRLGLSLDAVIRVLLDRNDDHKRRSSGQRKKGTESVSPELDVYTRLQTDNALSD